MKWIKPVTDGISELPGTIMATFIGKLDALMKKYDTTFEDVEHEIQDTETSLSSMLDQLIGNEFDMQGLSELKKLLGGNENG